MRRPVGVVLIIFGALWIFSRLLNAPTMILIFGDVKRERGLPTAIKRLLEAEVFFGYGLGAVLIIAGVRLLKN